MVRLSLALALAAACGTAASTGPTPPTSPGPSDPTGAGAPTDAPTPAAVVARPGEQMIYKISLLGLDVAEFTVSIGAGTLLDGVPTIPVETHAVSSPLLTLFHKVDDTLQSWIDPTTGRPIAFRAHEMASAKSDALEDTEVRFAPDRFAVNVVRDGQPIAEEQIVRGHPYDVPSMLVFLRGWDAPTGATVDLDVMRSRTVWRVQLTVGKREPVVTALGEFATVRFDGSGVRLLRNGTEDPESDRRKFSLWVSDDADRVPVRLVAHTDYGDIRMDLVDYRAE